MAEMDNKQRTLDTYNKSAQQFVEYFRSIPVRVKDIDKAIALRGKVKNPRVVEIGCADGRDASEIIKRTNNYVGFDLSGELIKLARKQMPRMNFEVADALHFDYPKGTDIVFAFASLLHLNKQEIALVIDKVHAALKVGGIFYISLKKGDVYQMYEKKDQFGTRTFYLYNPVIIENLSQNKFEVVDASSSFKTDREWFEIVLRKI